MFGWGLHSRRALSPAENEFLARTRDKEKLRRWILWCVSRERTGQTPTRKGSAELANRATEESGEGPVLFFFFSPPPPFLPSAFPPSAHVPVFLRQRCAPPTLVSTPVPRTTRAREMARSGEGPTDRDGPCRGSLSVPATWKLPPYPNRGWLKWLHGTTSMGPTAGSGLVQGEREFSVRVGSVRTIKKT